MFGQFQKVRVMSIDAMTVGAFCPIIMVFVTAIISMSIKVRYFASLKEAIGHAETNVPFTGLLTVSEVWQLANPNRPLPDNVLVAVNMDYASLDHQVSDGDEVAFFPPVTGG